MPSRKTFIYCEKCGKKLIERLPNGLWKFVFGKKAEGAKGPPVEMLIHGSLSMRCIRRSCGHRNILNYFPPNQPKVEKSGKEEETKEKEE